MREVDDLILISVDDHIIEPPDLFVHHLAPKYLDRAPKLVRNDEGNDVWTFGEVVMETAALNAVAGRPKEEYGLEPQSLDEVRPGCYDVHERVKDMDAGGVLASMNFPSFPTFTARIFACDDLELSAALVRAYNDWHIDEWCGAYPARFIPMAVPIIWDAEADRRGDPADGRQGVPLAQLHGEPGGAGLPELPRRVLGPGVAGLLRHGHRALHPPRVVRAALHPRRRLATRRDDHPAAHEHPVGRRRPPVVPGAEAASPTCGWRCPRAAPGGSPTSSTRVDRTFEMHHAWTLQDFGGRLPSEVFREHFLTCFISDPVGIELRERDRRRQHRLGGRLPAQRLHVAPARRRSSGGAFADYAVPAAHIAKMTHENAMRWFSFDPFAHLPREEATVGALRRRAAGHDVATMSRSTRVRTPDEKLEGFRARARRAVAAAGN